MLTDFNLHVQKFFTEYLPKDMECSPKTIASYSETFSIFMKYLRDYEHILVEDMTIAMLTRTLVDHFLHYLCEVKHNSAATRNQRKAAIVSFVNYLSYEVAVYQQQYAEIKAIKIRTLFHRSPKFLSAEGLELFIKEVLAEPRNQLRNLLIISLMAGAGLRVSEVINLRPKDLNLGEPASMVVIGKGSKPRTVPLQKQIVKKIISYLKMTRLEHPARREEYLFTNHLGQPISRHGVYHLVKNYADKARKKAPELIPEDVTPHVLRHTFATLNIAKGVDLIYVRDLLGHSSVQTTEQFYIGHYKKVREANAVSESLSKLTESEDFTSLERINNKNENTLSFLENLTKRRIK